MNIENTRILVTGGTGFLGNHTLKALLKRGADVTLLIQPHEKVLRLKAIGGHVNIIKSDLTNCAATQSAVQKVKPEVIIHFAGWMERRRDLSILNNFMELHVSATLNLFMATDIKATKLVINTGTSEEYGEQDDPFVEGLAVDPVSPYSATKAAVTAIATYLSRAISVPVITMRPFIVYGPGQLHDTLIPSLIKGVLRKQPVELTEGLQYRDFIFVDDLVSCYLAAIENADIFSGPEIFNIGSGRKTTVREVIETIADLMDGHEYLMIGTRQMRPGEPESMIADINKAIKVLGWEPKVSLRDGLRKTVAWWLENEIGWKE